MLKQFENFTLFDYIVSLLAIVTIICVDSTALSLVCAISGVLYIIQAAKGNIWSYFWGIINISTYIFIAYNSNYAGDFSLNLIFELPMQFVGIYAWSKHYNNEEEHVEVRNMTKAQSIRLIFFIIILTGLLYGIMPNINNLFQMESNPAPLIDAFTTTCSLLTLLLMALRYSEQWITWLFVDIFSIVMWIIIGNNNAMVIMWFTDFVISVYGLYNWRKLAT